MASLTGDLFPAEERGRIYGFVLSGEATGFGGQRIIVFANDVNLGALTLGRSTA